MVDSMCIHKSLNINTENILYFLEHFSNVVFNCNGMGILNIDLNIYDEDDPDTVILIKHLA